jgi:hypothetical protein
VAAGKRDMANDASGVRNTPHPGLGCHYYPPHDGPTHPSGSWLVAIHYHVGDLHSLSSAGFYRRFQNVPPSP